MHHAQYSYDAMAGFGATTAPCAGYNFADTHAYVCAGSTCHALDAQGQPVPPAAVSCVSACPPGFERYVVTSKNDGSVKKWCIRPEVAGAMVAAGHKVSREGLFGLPSWALPAGVALLGAAGLYAVYRSTSAPAQRLATPNFRRTW